MDSLLPEHFSGQKACRIFLLQTLLLSGIVSILFMSSPFSVPAIAGQVEFSSSMNPVGSGARAAGMGGAFIAVADDATAASWNPAGLIHLEKPEISVVYSYFNRGHDYHSTAHPELGGTTHGIDMHDINYASIAYPFTLLDRNMIITVNYQRLYDMNKKALFNYSENLSGGDFINNTISFKQDGYLGAISPAIAIQILPEFYFGATVNIWDDVFGTSSWGFTENGTGTGKMFGADYFEKFQWSEKNTFSGLNANLGLLYTLMGKYSFGFVFKTPFTSSVNNRSHFESEISIPSIGFFSKPPPEDKVSNLKIDMPLSYGFGFAYRHSDSLTFALDIYRTQWSDYAITEESGKKKNPISGAPLEQGKPKDTTQVRVGAEYLYIGNKLTVPLRGGIFYDPEPGMQKINDFFGFSVGSGVSYDRIAFDFSYQYRWGNRVSADIAQSGISSNINQHTVMTSLIYHF